MLSTRRRGVYVDILGEADRPYMDKLEDLLPMLKEFGIIEIMPNWKQKIIGLKNNLRKSK